MFFFLSCPNLILRALGGQWFWLWPFMSIPIFIFAEILGRASMVSFPILIFRIKRVNHTHTHTCTHNLFITDMLMNNLCINDSCVSKQGIKWYFPPLVLSTLDKIFSRQHFEIFFLIFFQKTNLTFHANCLQWRQFAWNVKSCLLGKIRKKIYQFGVCWISSEYDKG